jgi:PAS domain S-box-containing protein
VTQDSSVPLDASDPSSLRLLEAVAHQSPTGLLVFDPDLRYVLVNRQMAAMANTPAEQLLGRSVRDAFPEYSALTSRVERVLATGEPFVGFDVTGRAPGDGVEEHVWSLSAYRLVDDDGTVLGVAVTSTDVTAARAMERERTMLAERLELLAASGELLASGLDEQATVKGVLSLVVPAVAQWACLHLVDESDGTIRLAALRHADVAVQPMLERVLSAFRVTTDQPFGAGRVLATGFAEDLPEVTDQMLAELAGDDPTLLSGFRALQVAHGHVVPLSARGTTFGALSLSLHAERDDVQMGVADAAAALVARQELVADVAARAALALDSARLYARQHEVAVTLQRSLLPQSLPRPPGWGVAAQYLPGAAGTEVGGDFYEAAVRADGRLVFAIGDVMGRGIRAAAVMGQVRAALRGYALEGHAPAGILRRLNVMVSAMEDSSIVTCLVGTLDVTDGQMELACAGHVPPVVASPAGACARAALDPGPPLGVFGAEYGSTRGHVPHGGALVVFTDGLVEARDQPVVDGIAALCSVLGEVLHPAGPPITAEAVCAAAIGKMGRGEATLDDVAILVIRRDPKGPGENDAAVSPG